MLVCKTGHAECRIRVVGGSCKAASRLRRRLRCHDAGDPAADGRAVHCGDAHDVALGTDGAQDGYGHHFARGGLVVWAATQRSAAEWTKPVDDTQLQEGRTMQSVLGFSSGMLTNAIPIPLFFLPQSRLPSTSRSVFLTGLFLHNWCYTVAGLLTGLASDGGVSSFAVSVWNSTTRTMRAFDAATDIVFVRFMLDQVRLKCLRRRKCSWHGMRK
jgi:hypothetical protein